MRVLICHNFYQQPGGEDQVFAAETDMLRARGHDVETFTLHNDAVAAMGKLELAAKTIWNRQAAGEVRIRTRKHRAEIVHFHNTFPLFSPLSYSAARSQGAAVVQTLHNYRLLCPAATFFREGKPCEKCLGHLPLPAVAYGCYRDNRAATAITAAMLGTHRLLRTYAGDVDAYIALTKFAREKFVWAGFPQDKLFVKPNFVEPDPGVGSGDGGFALFVGRLTEEKGIRPLLAAWKSIGNALPLKICGDGPLAEEVANTIKDMPGVQWLGRKPFSQVIELMGRATVLVFPSIWYEGLPRTIVESYARGTPVAASDLGSMRELIDPGKTGLLFRPGDPEHMAKQILRLAGDGPLLAAMRKSCREDYLSRYGADLNHSMMLEIYQHAMRRGVPAPAESSSKRATIATAS